MTIKAIIGLGNPGHSYYYHRHSIGFRVLDALAEKYAGTWRSKDEVDSAEITLNGKNVLLLKPTTFMNTSGRVMPALIKKGITVDQVLVVHDELELPFGKLTIKCGGSARGHNGLKSIIAAVGDGLNRLRFGIGRPDSREMVPDYVLENFSESAVDVDMAIAQAVELIEKQF